MWRFKPFMPKETAGLEGRTVDVGNLKVHVTKAIAEGGFSCVYHARDAMNPSKQYALKHMICNDEESLDLVQKEISVMKRLKGHPNIVTLAASSILDMIRTKEALLVMDFCDKSLVNVLESRGAGYYEEKQVLLIFRDICNAVFAMHCQSPPIAHRDLKAENVLVGSDGAWRLCDFGSTSTNHKCFDRPEEMGIEEDNIRKHTTPAYRAPEMWDLYRKEVISEKVDIWALGCLLYRICYFKSAFDGESKLQILNGNYRIPDLPKYSSSITDLIKDMLQPSPDARPDITQVWFRVNLQLPEELQKQMPDGPTPVTVRHIPSSNVNDEGAMRRASVMPKRNPPPPPSSREQGRNNSPQFEKEASNPRPRAYGGADSVGSFWSTQHAQDAQVLKDKGPVFDKEASQTTSKISQQNSNRRVSPPREQHTQPAHRKGDHGNSLKRFDDGPTEDFEIRFDQDGSSFGKAKASQPENQKLKATNSDNVSTLPNEAFNNFVAEFDVSKLYSGSSNIRSNRSVKEDLEAEVERLKEQLKQVNIEKAEITSKCEKLSAICRSQRQEIQELKQSHAAAAPSLANKDNSISQSSPGSWQSSTPQREKIEGSVFELQQGMFSNASSSPSPDDVKPWQAFVEEPKAQPPSKSIHPKSVRTTSGRHSSKQSSPPSAANDSKGFGQDSFSAAPSNSQISKNGMQGGTSQRYTNTEPRKVEKSAQPAGWAGF